MNYDDLRAFNGRPGPSGNGERTGPDVVADVPMPVEFTDAHVGESFGEVIRGSFLHCKALGGWLRWDGQRWRRDEQESVYELARRYVIDLGVALVQGTGTRERINQAVRYRERSKLEALVAIARRLDGIAAEASSFDRHPDLLVCTNGVVDLRGGELRPHDPALRITKTTGVAYHSGATHADVSAALEAADGPVRDWLRRLFGYAATGHVTEDVMPVLDGRGANGKTTILGAVYHALGEYAHEAPSKLLMRSRHDEHPTLLADLHGRRLVTVDETAEGGSLNVEQVKSLVGGKAITGRFMRCDYFTFEPTHQLVVATNHRPAVNAIEHATWRRLRLVPFPHRYERGERRRAGDREADPTLRERVRYGQAQREATLAWIVQGATDWYRDGLDDCAIITDATDEWRRTEDVILRFTEDCCTIDPDGHALLRQLHDRYRAWCDTEGRPAGTSKELAKRFEAHDLYEDHDIERRKTNAGITYHGVRITP